MSMNESGSAISYKNVPTNAAIIILSVSVVLSVLIVACNLATILTFFINRHLRRRSIYCLIHLAVVDMMHGMSRILLEVCIYDFYFGSQLFSPVILLNIVLAVHDLMFAMCLFSLVLVSLERAYATFFPFRYRTLRFKNYILPYTSTWLLPALIIGVFMKTKSLPNHGFVFTTISITLFLICLIVIIALCKAILHNVKLQSKRLNPSQRETSIRRRANREHHLTVTLITVTLLSLITWLPWLVAVSVVWWYTKYISFIGYRLIIIIQLTNSLINPIVYVIRMRDYRKAMVQLIFRCSRDVLRPHPVVRFANNSWGNEAVVQLRFR